MEDRFPVVYSRMDAAAIARLDKSLEVVDPEVLRGLKTPGFTKWFAEIYLELDYIHPFSDGNSRTLRVFTKQLAKEAGYDVDWGRFNRNPADRDRLYIARDLGVIEKAIPHVRGNYLQAIHETQYDHRGRETLPELLREAVRPSRAVAFERMTEQKVLKQYPELREAYKTIHDATKYFAAKMPGKSEVQEANVQAVVSFVQDRLNAGETTGFARSREQDKQERQSAQHKPGPERER